MNLNMILKCKNFLDKEKAIFMMKVVLCLYIKCSTEKTNSLLMGKDCIYFYLLETRRVPGIQ